MEQLLDFESITNRKPTNCEKVLGSLVYVFYAILIITLIVLNLPIDDKIVVSSSVKKSGDNCRTILDNSDIIRRKKDNLKYKDSFSSSQLHFEGEEQICDGEKILYNGYNYTTILTYNSSYHSMIEVQVVEASNDGPDDLDENGIFLIICNKLMILKNGLVFASCGVVNNNNDSYGSYPCWSDASTSRISVFFSLTGDIPLCLYLSMDRAISDQNCLSLRPFDSSKFLNLLKQLYPKKLCAQKEEVLTIVGSTIGNVQLIMFFVIIILSYIAGKNNETIEVRRKSMIEMVR